jgi:hypothetical protein
MCDWLRDFLRRRSDAALAELGPALAAELELAMSAVPREHRGTIVHIGGFERPERSPSAVRHLVRPRR